MKADRYPVQRHRACLLLGSNIQPEPNLRQAISMLRKHFIVEKVSGVWESPAVGSQGPNFLNVAVVISTSLEPAQLKEGFLRPLEAQLGRVRKADKNAPREIDIDIVAWDSEVIDADVWRHAHAALPVAELLPCYQSQETGEYLEQTAERLRKAISIRPRPEVNASLSFAGG